MTPPRRISRINRILLLLVPGSLVLGSSCATAMRDAVIDAGAGFVQDVARALLDALFFPWILIGV